MSVVLEGFSLETEAVEKNNVAFRRLATAAAFASLLSYAIVLCVTMASINEIGRFYHASAGQLGWLYRSMMLGFVVAVIIAGRYSDKFGKIPIILLGCLGMAVGVYLFARTTSFSIAIAAMAIMGIGGGAAEGLASAVISDLYGGARRTSMMNLSQVLFGVGAVSGPFAIAKLVQAGINWRIGYVGAAIICIVSALITLVALLTRGEKPLSTVHGEGHGWFKLLSDPLVLWLSVGIMFYVGAETGQANWLARYFAKDLGSSGPLAAVSVALFWFGITVGRWVAAWLSKHFSDYALIRMASAAAAISQAVLLLVHSVTPALIADFALGFCLAPVFPTILSSAGAAHPRQSGTVFGIVVAAGAMGAAIFPPTIGGIADMVGMRSALWICVILSALNLILFLKLRPRSA